MTRQVHPVADLFPMLEGEDLQALADDIAHRGLVHPIVLDTDGQVLDGRNRLAACQLAAVEPTFRTYTGDDPAGFVMASNITRRHLTKGQQAMLAAQARAVSGKPLREVAAELGVSKARVAYAATVLEHAPDLVADVTAGTTPLNVAYFEARARKDTPKVSEPPSPVFLEIKAELTKARRCALQAGKMYTQLDGELTTAEWRLLVRAADRLAVDLLQAQAILSGDAEGE